MTSFRETLLLSIYGEVLGPLGSLTCQDGTLIASIGEIQLALPAELEQNLRSLVGQKIAILRTDIPGKEYLFRVIPNDGQFSKIKKTTLLHPESIAVEVKVI
jgi:hypothetical protein